MTYDHIKYIRLDAKYSLKEDYQIFTDIIPPKTIRTKYIVLYGGKGPKAGLLWIKAGFLNDGPSGPVPDTDENMRAAAVHDALYRLLQMGLLDKIFRKSADHLFMIICIQDKVPVAVAETYYLALRKFGGKAARVKKEKIYRAPTRKK